MIVAELIRQLQALPQDMIVKVYEHEPDAFVPVTNVVVTKYNNPNPDQADYVQLNTDFAI